MFKLTIFSQDGWLNLKRPFLAQFITTRDITVWSEAQAGPCVWEAAGVASLAASVSSENKNGPFLKRPFNPKSASCLSTHCEKFIAFQATLMWDPTATLEAAIAAVNQLQSSGAGTVRARVSGRLLSNLIRIPHATLVEGNHTSVPTKAFVKRRILIL